MNPILQVKLRFEKEKNKPNFGPKNLKTSAKVSCEKVNKLLKDLENVLYFYHNSPKIVDKILIDVNYNDIVAKSNRITEILKSQAAKVVVQSPKSERKQQRKAEKN